MLPVVPAAEFFQYPVIEFLIKKLGIVHRFISQKNSHRQQYKSGHPHPCKRLHHVFLHKFSSEIIQQKKDDKKYNSKDQGQTDATFSDDGTQGGAYQKKYETGNGHRDFFMPRHQVHPQVLTVIFICKRRNIRTGFDIVYG
jgi:hypothetical protein